jgi:hypothetical protein
LRFVFIKVLRIKGLAGGVLSTAPGFIELKINIVMQIIKTSEKIIVWLHRTGITMQDIANESGTTRQSVSQQIKDNVITINVIQAIKRLGFQE